MARSNTIIYGARRVETADVRGRCESLITSGDFSSSDVSLTYVARKDCFGISDLPEFSAQLSEWKRLRAVCSDYNVRKVEIAGKEFYMFVIQNRVMSENPFDVLAMSVANTLVSGYAYFTPNKALCDYVVAQLAENKPEPEDE